MWYMIINHIDFMNVKDVEYFLVSSNNILDLGFGLWMNYNILKLR